MGALKEQSCGCKYKHRRPNHCNASVLLADFFLVVCSLLCRYIKLSSPNLNNVTIVGCIMGYSTVFLSGLDGRLSNSMYTYACRVRQNPAIFFNVSYYHFSVKNGFIVVVVCCCCCCCCCCWLSAVRVSLWFLVYLFHLT